MRLHVLELSAFQAFADPVRVDFDALTAGGVFLLHGETGAGKTTLLDAVCFALYGAVPGLREQAARLRSDHARDDVRTQVTLEATIGGDRLRVVRSPRQQRAKLRGEGTTEEAMRVSLSVRDADGTWRVVADRAGEVEAEIADRVGLTREQFCRVVMLPQGEFSRFLHANDDERKALLEPLFATERFTAAQGWLVEQRKQAESAVHRGLDAAADVLSRAAQVARTEPPEGWRDEPESAREWLDAQVVVAQAAEATADAAREAAVAAHEGAVERHAEVAALATLQARRSAAATELAGWEAGRARRDHAERELTLARAAAPVAPLATAARAAHATMEQLTRAAEAAVRGVAGDREPPVVAVAGKAPAEAAPGEREPPVEAVAGEPPVEAEDAPATATALAAGPAARPVRATPPGQGSLFDLPPELVIPAPVTAAGGRRARPRDARSTAAAPDPVYAGWSARACRAEAAAARERSGAIRGAVQLESVLGTVEQEIAGLDERARIAVEQSVAAEAWLTGAAERRAALAVAAESSVQAEARRAGLTATHEDAARRHRAALERDRLADAVASATAGVRAARDAVADARQAWLDAREARLAGIAAELAGELRDGDPCRVCGSCEHPAPTVHGDGPVVDAAAEEALDRAQGAAQHAHEEAGARLAKLELELAAQQAIAGDESPATLETRVVQATARLAEASALAELAPERAAALTAHDLEVREAERVGRDAAARAATLAAERAGAAARCEEHRGAVEAARGGHPTVAAHVTALEHTASAWDAAATAIDRAAGAAEQARAVRESALELALAHGFGHLPAAESAARSADAMAELADTVTAYDRRLEQLRGILEDPELTAAAAEPPAPVEETAARRAATEQTTRAAEREHEVAHRAATALHALAGELRDRLVSLAPLLERRTLTRGVAGLADGSAAANLKHMPLGAYVVASRLEQVADAASARLLRMSGGRYELRHSDTRGSRSRKAGLGLHVVDGWTGCDRPPASLSGGETFQASLALALGLADVVGAEAGGIRLDTLFVDEGFGSLGERALDDVLDVLDGLREGGRAVGLISHVAELRQRVPTQLHVVQGRSGSTLAEPVVSV